MQLRRPVVLVGDVEAPGCGQLAAGAAMCPNDAPKGRALGTARQTGEYAVAHHPKAIVITTLDLHVRRVVGLSQISQSAVGVVYFALEVLALSDHREIQTQAGANDIAPLIAGMSGGRSGIVVHGINFVSRGHDLGAAPSLVHADIADDVWRLNAAISGSVRDRTGDGTVAVGRYRGKQAGSTNAARHARSDRS